MEKNAMDSLAICCCSSGVDEPTYRYTKRIDTCPENSIYHMTLWQIICKYSTASQLYMAKHRSVKNDNFAFGVKAKQDALEALLGFHSFRGILLMVWKQYEHIHYMKWHRFVSHQQIPGRSSFKSMSTSAVVVIRYTSSMPTLNLLLRFGCSVSKWHYENPTI